MRCQVCNRPATKDDPVVGPLCDRLSCLHQALGTELVGDEPDPDDDDPENTP